MVYVVNFLSLLVLFRFFEQIMVRIACFIFSTFMSLLFFWGVSKYWSLGYKTFFMLNSAELEILTAPKCKKPLELMEFLFLNHQGQSFIRLINV